MGGISKWLALFLCLLSACGSGIPDDKTYVYVRVAGLGSDLTALNISASLDTGKSFAFNQVDLSSPDPNLVVVLQFARTLRGALTITAVTSGSMCYTTQSATTPAPSLSEICSPGRMRRTVDA